MLVMHVDHVFNHLLYYDNFEENLRVTPQFPGFELSVNKV